MKWADAWRLISTGILPKLLFRKKRSLLNFPHFSANLCEDRQVQRLMDDLDLPKDRANLFEALDADSSGALHLAELAQGLLKVRGELKKLSLCSWDFWQGRKV